MRLAHLPTYSNSLYSDLVHFLHPGWPTDQRSHVGQRLSNALHSTQYGPWHLGIKLQLERV